RITGIDALAADHYAFSPREEALLYSTLRLNAFHTDTPGVLIPHYKLAPAGRPVPMALTTTLVIDDDGSANNNGPDPSQVAFPWSNQTAQVTAALDNSS